MSTGKLSAVTFLVCVLTWVPWESGAQAPVREAGGVNQRLERLEQSLQSQGLLDMMQQLQSLQQEIKNLRGVIEVQSHTIEQLQQRQRALYTDLDQRLQGLEHPGAGSATTTVPVPGPDQDAGNPPLQTLAPVESQVEPATADAAETPLNLSFGPVESPQQSRPTTPALTPIPSATTMLEPGLDRNQVMDPAMARTEYEHAFSFLKQSQYEQAIRAFREYLAAYPNSDYADNAQYWLGEAYYVLHQFDQAIVEYKALVNNYPDSQKYTQALLKIGYSYQELGQLEQARKVLLDLEQRYPQTTASRLAAERLKAIDVALRQQAGSNPQPAAVPN